ncbi:MAG: helicase-associated domain-containing protein [Anaerolineales bacterium]|nr:helicase-associated domain-containing protein [Anaerolineales bacterium]
MRSLAHTLEDQDTGYLRILCELWGFDSPLGSRRSIVEGITRAMLKRDTLDELLDSLPDAAKQTLEGIARASGRLAFPDLIRDHGELREMGPGKRDREQPWRSPASPVEMLWYRGLIGRAFADTSKGPQEFAYIPTDLLQLLSESLPEYSIPLLSPLTRDPKHIRLATSAAIDDATTLLAAMRRTPLASIELDQQQDVTLERFLLIPRLQNLLLTILQEMSLIEGPPWTPNPERTRSFIAASRSQAVGDLLLAWKDSVAWNDLAALPHIVCGTNTWPNDARLSRQGVLDLLQPLKPGLWWDLNDFMEEILQIHPAFQRPGGDFDSWYLQDQNGIFLHGIENWNRVDGAFLRYVITGPLHWLGSVDLGHDSQSTSISSFRLTPVSALLYDPKAPVHVEEPEKAIIIHADGRIIAPRGVNGAVRYQIARFSHWVSVEDEQYEYRLTPSTLQRASEQGLSHQHIRAILEKTCESPLPRPVDLALSRWAEKGTEARIKRYWVLRVQTADVLEMLRSKKSTSRYLLEILSPTTAIVKATDWPKLQAAAARLGFLIDPPNANE